LLNLNILLGALGNGDDSSDNPGDMKGPPVDITFAGQSLSGFGTVPFVEITESANGEETNILSTTTNITLNGKIIEKDANLSFTALLNKGKSLENIFRSNVVGLFNITHSGSVIYVASGAYVKSFSLSPTQNNWNKYIDYTANLEFKSKISGNNFNIESRSDVWNIEPIDDFIHNNYSISLNNFQPTADRDTYSANSTNSTLNMSSPPQYRISRTLSAKGLLPPISGTGHAILDKLNRMKFLHAKDWVNYESNTLASGFNGSISINTGEFYNHTRTIGANVYEGTYTVTDSWLTIPSGVTHTETFTLDSSTQENGVKTVRVAGNVIGVNKPKANQTNTTHNVLVSGANGVTINLSQYNDNTDTNKYNNARIAMSSMIRPKMYSRACIPLISHVDRSNRVSSINLNPHTAANPIYMKEFPLNITPVSSQETHDPINGNISYVYEYNNQYSSISGVMRENIRITNQSPTDIISELDTLTGSVIPSTRRNLFSLGRSTASKTISIDIIVNLPPSSDAMIRTHADCPLYCKGPLYHRVLNLVSGNKPFEARANVTATPNKPWGNNTRAALSGTVYIDSDQETWNPTTGSFSKIVTWKYQQCQIAKSHFLH
jgi:hypothetical protein